MIGITVANNKGGVGKTTLSSSIAGCMAQKGYKVLLIDNDPQANATCHLNREGATPTMFDMFAFGTSVDNIIIHTDIPNLDLLPSAREYKDAKNFIEGVRAYEKLFVKKLHPYVDGYDFVIIDCLPEAGKMLDLSLTFSDYVLIPIIPDEFSRQASEVMTDAINEIKENYNPSLKILGLVLNLKEHSNRYKDENFDENMVMKTRISKLEDFKHAQDAHCPITVFAPRSKAAQQIIDLTDECLSIIKRG